MPAPPTGCGPSFGTGHYEKQDLIPPKTTQAKIPPKKSESCPAPTVQMTTAQKWEKSSQVFLGWMVEHGVAIRDHHGQPIACIEQTPLELKMM